MNRIGKEKIHMGTIAFKASAPVYVSERDNGGNPYRLTPAVTDDGQNIFAAEGNGCANDIPFDGIEGWTDDEISAMYGDIGVDAMRSAIDELRDGSFEDEADWLTNWLERFVKAMETSGGSDD